MPPDPLALETQDALVPGLHYVPGSYLNTHPGWSLWGPDRLVPTLCGRMAPYTWTVLGCAGARGVHLDRCPACLAAPYPGVICGW